MEITLKIGPFVTEHHQQAIDEEAVSKIYSYIKETVIPRATPNYAQVTGEFSASYDDPRFFGPLSICKYWYHLGIEFHHSDSNKDEHFSATLVLEPERGIFKEHPRCGLILFDRPSGPKWDKLRKV